ncbi:hypothetical protein ENSA5_01200 [Enhygromyxa salina]|uniref:DUF4390 domain-containing protein n=1 Tax=Enhygromyxa salina TaxID=215803 RepID=A0A2S9YL12_9BACT|nr:hypothetical protein [Enhygromyxa salina]PRQ05800.1 hypothetical protein ENSA5_01200 [Enhygromyxa salina]
MTGPGALGRRRMLGLALASPALVVLLGAVPEALPRRKAKFSYTSRELKIRVAVPDLLRTTDKQAMKMLDGGYPTRLVYDMAVYAKGSRTPSAAVHVEVSVQWDPWNQDYIVQTTIGAGSPTVRRYALRADAIKASTTLSVAVAKTSDIPRGEDQIHFVQVIAQRNPIEAKSSGAGGAARGQDRDLEVFSRWVGMFVRTRPKAEKVIEFRTHPFYVPHG